VAVVSFLVGAAFAIQMEHAMLERDRKVEVTASKVSQPSNAPPVVSSPPNPVSSPPNSVSPQPEPTLGAEEIATKISIWESVGNVNHNALVIPYNQIDASLTQWPDLIKSASGRQKLHDDLVSNTAAFWAASNDLETLRSNYKEYPEISDALAQTRRADLAKASSDFSGAVIKENMDYSSPDYVSKLRPLAGALRREMNATVKWINELQKTSTAELKKLSSMK